MKKGGRMAVKAWLQGLSYRTGVWVLAACVPFYLLSFGQMLLPISVGMKTVAWTVLFGLAKTFQYAGLTIIGAEGLRRLRRRLRSRRQ